VRVRPVIVALYSQNPSSDLIVTADLGPSDCPAGGAASEVSKNRIAPIVLSPQAADISTGIASSPSEHRHNDRWRPVDRSCWCGQVRSVCGTCCNQHHKCETAKADLFNIPPPKKNACHATARRRKP